MFGSNGQLLSIEKWIESQWHPVPKMGVESWRSGFPRMSFIDQGVLIERSPSLLTTVTVVVVGVEREFVWLLI
jgi:hypothetical protein